MGKNLKYGEFDFGQPKTAMKKGGMCKTDSGYAKGGPKMPAKREPEAMVRKEVALLRKAGAPKALVRHEVREMSGEMDTPATKKAEVSMMRKAKAPLSMLKHEMSEPTGLKEGGQYAAGTRSKMDAQGKAVNKMAKKFGTETQKYAKGGSVEAKLEKHANLPASKAHGPGAGNKLAKGGVPTFSKTPKFGKTK